MGIGDWGLGIGDWGLGPIPNPKIKKDKKKMESDISSEGEESNIDNKNKNGIELDEEKEEI